MNNPVNKRIGGPGSFMIGEEEKRELFNIHFTDGEIAEIAKHIQDFLVKNS